jgi:hypothetical protein
MYMFMLLCYCYANMLWCLVILSPEFIPVFIGIPCLSSPNARSLNCKFNPVLSISITSALLLNRRACWVLQRPSQQSIIQIISTVPPKPTASLLLSLRNPWKRVMIRLGIFTLHIPLWSRSRESSRNIARAWTLLAG